MLHKTDFTEEFCKELLLKYGNKLSAARALEGTVFNESGKAVSAMTITRWMLEALNLSIAGREEQDTVSRIEKLLLNHNIPISAIGKIDNVKIGMWGVHSKDADGNVVTNVLDKTSLTITPSSPLFPLVDKAAAGPIITRDFPKLLRTTKTAFIFSDAQIGYLINPETKELDPIHDPAAMEVAMQVMQSVRPSEVAIIGDWLDLAFASRWAQHAEFDTPNESIQAGYDYLREIKANAGPQLEKFTFVEGNHDQRLEKMLLEHNKTAMRIKRASSTSEWPVFTLPYLLRFDELGIKTTGRYPGGDYYMMPDLMLTHAPPRVAEINASVIHGHQHKISMSPRVAHSSAGRQTYFMYDIGCLCRVDTTSDLQRLMVTHVPSDRGRTNWTQGVAVVNILDGKIPFYSVDLVSINDGKCLYGGQFYDAT
jgi:metallophosphoesterase superfamily enzyme